MNRIGAVITFKPGVSRDEAARALRSIHFLLDTPETVSKPSPSVRAALDSGSAVRFNPQDWHDEPFDSADLLNEYDDRDGGPVWYVP